VKAALPHGGIHGTRILESDEDLSRLLSGLEPRERVLVQPRLRNPLTSIGLVMTRTGDIAARFQHVAKWTWPSRAGSTARAASVAPDEGLVSRVGALLAEIGYWGLAEVELLESPLGPALIDVNPRFYGCMALPLACGVNLPAAWHAVAAGMPPPRPGDYRVGVAYRWLEADIVAALRGDAGRMLHAAPRPRTGAMWAGDDPVPGPLLARTAFSARAARRLRQRLR
jgi:predicted ATP-grasp superfamily ATP-dependent carboligase